jgi:hypothetical protein
MAPISEKVWNVLVPEFGDDTGKLALIVRVLIPQVRPARKYPIPPWEMIHLPGGDNAVCR